MSPVPSWEVFTSDSALSGQFSDISELERRFTHPLPVGPLAPIISFLDKPSMNSTKPLDETVSD